MDVYKTGQRPLKKMVDQTYMLAALAEAKAALSRNEFPVGCVMVAEERVIATGKRTNSSGPLANEFDHAEIQTIRTLLETGIETNMSEITVYSTMEPCLMCYTALLLNGIRRIVYAYEDVMGGGTSLDLSSLNPLYAAMEVEIVPGVCREESLALFRAFFADSKNSYWKDSLLAKHIMEQHDLKETE